MVLRTMSRFDLHRKHPSACLHAVGPDASSTRTLLLSLSTIAGTKISNPPWVNFQSAGWVSFQSAPTDWVILDAIVTEDERVKVAAAGCQPMFLFAHKVVHDEQRRFEPGHWVRSSMSTSFEEGFLFATRNTVYVLLGPGRRKSSSIQAIFSIF
jgi:hypothetical protein